MSSTFISDVFTLHVYGRERMAVSNCDNHVAGTVKFDRAVPVELLLVLIVQMKSKNPERWVDLHVRGAGSDGTHYIAFHYILPDGKKKTHKKAMNALLQFFRDQLGTRPMKKKKPDPIPLGVMGWSVSTVRAVVK